MKAAQATTKKEVGVVQVTTHSPTLTTSSLAFFLATRAITAAAAAAAAAHRPQGDTAWPWPGPGGLTSTLVPLPQESHDVHNDGGGRGGGSNGYDIGHIDAKGADAGTHYDLGDGDGVGSEVGASRSTSSATWPQASGRALMGCRWQAAQYDASDRHTSALLPSQQQQP